MTEPKPARVTLRADVTAYFAGMEAARERTEPDDGE